MAGPTHAKRYEPNRGVRRCFWMGGDRVGGPTYLWMLLDGGEGGTVRAAQHTYGGFGVMREICLCVRSLVHSENY